MNTDNRCPRCGEISTGMDICSECGASMDETGLLKSVPAPSAGATPVLIPNDKDCPVCGEVRPSAQARYCDNCRYDFVLHAPFIGGDVSLPSGDKVAHEQPAVAVTIPTVEPIPDTSVDAGNMGSSMISVTPPVFPIRMLNWDAVVVADPTLNPDENNANLDIRERVFPLDLDQNVIGRKGEPGPSHPQVFAADPGISKKHARIDRLPDGHLVIMDLNSTNGTTLNGNNIDSNIAYPIEDRDEIIIGIHTRIRIRSR